MHVTLLHLATRRGFLDRDDDNVAHAREATLRSAQHLDALDALGAAVVSDVKIGLHLDPGSGSFLFGLPGQFPAVPTSIFDRKLRKTKRRTEERRVGKTCV